MSKPSVAAMLNEPSAFSELMERRRNHKISKRHKKGDVPVSNPPRMDHAEVFIKTMKSGYGKTIGLWLVYFDGGVIQGNGYGSYQIISPNSKAITRQVILPAKASTEAELMAMHRAAIALDCMECEGQAVIFYSDCDSLIKWANGKVKLRIANSKEIKTTIRVICEKIKAQFVWVPRKIMQQKFGH